MMCGIKYLLPCLFHTACTVAETGLPEKEPDEEETSALSVSFLSLTEGTKAVYENTGADGAGNILKTIGVLVTKGSDNSREYYSTLVEKQIFTCSKAGGSDGGGEALTWTADKTLNLGDTDGTVYAWAPSDAEGKLDESSIPVLSAPVILSEQSFVYGNEWETDQIDYLYGTDAEKKAPVVNHLSPSVALSMQHALAKISFRVMKAEGQEVTTEDYVKKLELTSNGAAFVVASNPSSAVMRLTDGVLTGTSTTTALTLTAKTENQGQVAAWSEPVTEVAEAAESGYTVVTSPQAYGLVAPCTGKMGVKITLGPTGALDAVKDHTYQTKENTVAATWEQGKHYVYTMTVTDKGIEFSQVQVVGWDDSPEAVVVPVE